MYNMGLYVSQCCLRLRLLQPVFSACTKMPLDVPKVETRMSNFPSKPIVWASSRALSMVESLSLREKVTKKKTLIENINFSSFEK